jgi:hypothetical protein
MQYLSVQGGSPPVVRADAVLTNAYVASSSVNMGTYDSAFIRVKVGTAQAGKICKIKVQWSDDDTVFDDETVDTPAASSSGTPGIQPFDPYIREVNVPMDTASYAYRFRVRRMGTYLRVSCKSDATTTGTVSVTILKASNYN